MAVLAPLAGRLLPMSELPDPVFAAEMVGPGVAVDPTDTGEPVTVLSPIAGTLVKVHPHAFVVLGPDGVGVLVHLGLDTVRLEGARLRGARDRGQHRRGRRADGHVGRVGHPRRGALGRSYPSS